MLSRKELGGRSDSPAAGYGLRVTGFLNGAITDVMLVPGGYLTAEAEYVCPFTLQ